MTSPLNKKLEQVKWGEFKITDLVVPLKGKRKLTKDNLTSNGAVDVYSSESSNNGIIGQTDLEADYLVSENNPFYIVFGDHTRSMNIASRSFSVMDNVKVLSPKFKTISEALFICSAWKKAIPNLGYARHWSIAQNSTFQLPVNQNREPNFEFINSFVEELEAERVEELEAYLTTTRLKNYELTTKENELLQDISTLKFKEFNLARLFGQSTRGKRLKSSDRVQGNLPFVTAGETNEGISDFIGNNVQIFSKNTTTIDMFGSAKYRNYPYGADDHIAVVHTESLEQNVAIFITAAIHKSSHNGQFNYGRNFYAKDADALNIMLPVKNDTPDFETMKTLITAVKKLVIKDVVEYTNHKIRATKQVIAQ